MKPAWLILLLLAMPVFSSASHSGTQRSSSVRRRFQLSHPCPANGALRGPCPGYVVDHIKALRCAGEDAPANLQWQTVDEAKKKNVWERRCS